MLLFLYTVLIVAKCIVNVSDPGFLFLQIQSINSSKVYCKCIFLYIVKSFIDVLIVAKCIVNVTAVCSETSATSVLIVAKCIVNDTGDEERLTRYVY